MSATQPCWYCQENETTGTNDILLSKDGHSATLRIPYCASCAQAHGRSVKAFFAGFALVALLGLAAGVAAIAASGASGSGVALGGAVGLLGALPGVGAGLLAHRRTLSRAGTRSQREALRHPAVLERLAAGYALGPAR